MFIFGRVLEIIKGELLNLRDAPGPFRIQWAKSGETLAAWCGDKGDKEALDIPAPIRGSRKPPLMFHSHLF